MTRGIENPEHRFQSRAEAVNQLTGDGFTCDRPDGVFSWRSPSGLVRARIYDSGAGVFHIEYASGEEAHQ